ncbi:MAG: hypothetical protein KatS3mg129_3250 [Leptospiraceae bacterium]|nr:MAG: hypothetical protein KatS3mg129_3250 [Leptospiraceae bacterium]
MVFATFKIHSPILLNIIVILNLDKLYININLFKKYIKNCCHLKIRNYYVYYEDNQYRNT